MWSSEVRSMAHAPKVRNHLDHRPFENLEQWPVFAITSPAPHAPPSLLPHSTWFCETVNISVWGQGAAVTQADQWELKTLVSVNGEGVSVWLTQEIESFSHHLVALSWEVWVWSGVTGGLFIQQVERIPNQNEQRDKLSWEMEKRETEQPYSAILEAISALGRSPWKISQ